MILVEVSHMYLEEKLSPNLLLILPGNLFDYELLMWAYP